MQINLIGVTFLLLNIHAAIQTKFTELEMCEKKLDKFVTVFRNLVTNFESEDYLFTRPRNCVDLLKIGNTESGIYTIYPRSWVGSPNPKLSVYCDMETDGGGWIVLQRREDYEPRQDFFLDWDNYKQGFGKLEKEFWLGNENIHVLTHQENVTLRVDLEDNDGERRYAKYDEFKLSNCEDRYRLHIGKYSGNAGDSLKYHNNATFVTRDNGDVENCAKRFYGGWWYVKCYSANLNGLYVKGANDTESVVSWHSFRGDRHSLKMSEIKIRASSFIRPE